MKWVIRPQEKISNVYACFRWSGNRASLDSAAPAHVTSILDPLRLIGPLRDDQDREFNSNNQAFTAEPTLQGWTQDPGQDGDSRGHASATAEDIGRATLSDDPRRWGGGGAPEMVWFRLCSLQALPSHGTLENIVACVSTPCVMQITIAFYNLK